MAITQPRQDASGLLVREAPSRPRALGTFDRGRDTQVTLRLAVHPADRPLTVVSRWYDPGGIERRVVSRTIEPSAAAGDAWHTHTVAMWELRPYPGRWTATVSVDGAPAGEYSFTLAR